MPIVKYVAVHSTPLSNIEYILNGDKNDDMKFATGLNCTADPHTMNFAVTLNLVQKNAFLSRKWI